MLLPRFLIGEKVEGKVRYGQVATCEIIGWKYTMWGNWKYRVTYGQYVSDWPSSRRYTVTKTKWIREDNLWRTK